MKTITFFTCLRLVGETSSASLDKGYLSFAWIFVPICLTAIVAILLVITIAVWRISFDELLAKSPIAKKLFMFVAILVIPAFAAIFVEAADFSELVNLRIDASGLVCSSLAGILTCLFIGGQWLMWVHDDSSSYRIKVAEAARDEARSDRDFFNFLNRVFLTCAERNRKRIYDTLAVLKKNGAVLELPALLNAFAPNLQLAAFVHMIYELFASEAHARFKDADVKLRAALFYVDDDCLHCVYAWDGVSKDCIGDVSRKISLESTMDSIAAFAVVNGQIMIEEDAVAANSDEQSPFNYFEASQRTRISSIIAMPISIESRPKSTIRYLVCVDSNLKKMFQLSRKGHYEKLVSNLAPRVHEVEMIEELLKLASKTGRELRDE